MIYVIKAPVAINISGFILQIISTKTISTYHSLEGPQTAGIFLQLVTCSSTETLPENCFH